MAPEYGWFFVIWRSSIVARTMSKLAGAKRFAIVFRPGMDNKKLAPKFDLICKLA